MKATARISSNSGHTVLPAAVRRYLGVGKGALLQFESRENGEVVVTPLPSLDSLFGSLKGDGSYHADESAQGWAARAQRLARKDQA